MAHRRARLTPLGRRLLVERIIELGWSVAAAAESFARHGVAIERVMTDGALNHRVSEKFQDALAELDATHIITPPYTPQWNGKVERFNRTLTEEWCYVRLSRSNEERLASLPAWLDTYKRRRPHTSLGGQSPMDALVKNVSGNYT